MLKIEVLHSRNFPNGLHVQCVTEIKKLTQENNPAGLGIANQYNDFEVWSRREDRAFEFIRRNKITEEKAKVDHARDMAYNGLCNYIKATTNHYDPETAAAAQRLMIIIETFNHPDRLIKRPYDAETASIKSFLENIRAQQFDFNRINLNEWAVALESKNRDFEALALEYIDETVGKPEYNMLQSRRGVEKSMRTMFHCINALVIMNGEMFYTSYINKLNGIIKHYNDVYAIHLGRYETNRDKENKEI